MRGAALALALIPSVSLAQLSLTASVLSDYRYRGISLSDDKPAVQASVNYDAANGWYAGAFASTVRYALTGEHGVQGIAYGGHAWRMAGGASFEAGASYTSASGTLGYDYPEVYVGVAADPLSARLYYAPRYSGYDTDTFYAEVNGVHRLDDRFSLFAHAGALHSPVDTPYFSRPDWVVDGRAGVAIDVDRVSVQLSWVGVSSAASYPFVVRHRNGAVLAVSASF